MKHIIYNATIVNEGVQYTGYVTIVGDKIAEVGCGAPSVGALECADSVVDLQGKFLLPGVIDDQVHFRDPGLTHKGDIATESAAAVAGGVTSFMDMPNTMPQTTTVAALEDKYALAAERSLANYSFYVGATNDNLNELKGVDYAKTCGVKLFLGASTGNMLVNSEGALDAIFADVPALIAIHSEDEGVIQRNKGLYTSKFGDSLPIHFHPMIRSEEACYVSTAKAVERADKYGTKLHVLHISTAKEMALLSTAPLSEKRITAEVCVHHLWFTDNDYSAYGNRIKWNPAIKTYADREALRDGLRTGKIDIVATDHAPHTVADKCGDVLRAASGGPLVQFSLVAMLEMVNRGIFTMNQVVNKMSHAPAELYGVVGRGYIRENYKADLVVVESGVQNCVVREDILSKCGWSPFEGEVFHNRVCRTYVNGNIVFDKGEIMGDVRGERLLFNR